MMQSVKLSALDHLKSELLRKKEDAEKNKRSIEEHQPKPFPQAEKEDLQEDKNDHKELPELTGEEAEKAKKARDILEAKAKLYDSLSEGIHLTKNSNLYLVNFEKKAAEDPHVSKSGGASTSGKIIDLAQSVKDDDISHEAKQISEHGSSTEDQSKDHDLGKLLDRELLSKARNLSKSDFSQQDTSKQDGRSDSSEPTLVSADMQRERMRQKWEEDERLARSKDDIHYQDVLYDEVRSHGVGYFAFSKDEEERRKQQAELEEMRRETLKKQEEFRRQKGIIDDGSNSGGVSEETKAEKASNKKLTEEEKLKNIEEALKSIRREVHVREWDKGKELPVMSQEEWIEKKRDERDNDFAPPAVYFEDNSGTRNRKRPIKAPMQNILFKKTPQLQEEQKLQADVQNIHESHSDSAYNSETNLASEGLTNIPLPNHSPSTGGIFSGHSVKDKEASSSAMNASNKEPSNLVKTVKSAKKSAMALLEQLMHSNPEVNEVAASEHSEKNASTSEPVESIPLPQTSVATKNDQPSGSKCNKPFFVPFNLIPRKFAPKPKVSHQSVTSGALSSTSAVSNIPLPSAVSSNASLSDTLSCSKISSSFGGAKISNTMVPPENNATATSSPKSNRFSTSCSKSSNDITSCSNTRSDIISNPKSSETTSYSKRSGYTISYPKSSDTTSCSKRSGYTISYPESSDTTNCSKRSGYTISYPKNSYETTSCSQSGTDVTNSSKSSSDTISCPESSSDTISSPESSGVITSCTKSSGDIASHSKNSNDTTSCSESSNDITSSSKFSSDTIRGPESSGDITSSSKFSSDTIRGPESSGDITSCSESTSDAFSLLERGEPSSHQNVGKPVDESTLSKLKVDVFPPFKGNSTENDKSTIKLGNLIKNRPAPKSGMALLEEIKKSTRDFRYGDELPNDSPPSKRKRGAEIAPPECLLHSTPQLPGRKRGLFTKRQDISDSISAGLDNLKSVSEKKKKKREKGMLDIL